MGSTEHQRQIIDTFVNSVYVFDDRVVLNFNFTDDAKTVTREEVLGSSAVDNAPLNNSYPNPILYEKGSGTFFVCRRFYSESAQSGKQAKARYHHNGSILPFMLYVHSSLFCTNTHT